MYFHCNIERRFLSEIAGFKGALKVVTRVREDLSAVFNEKPTNRFIAKFQMYFCGHFEDIVSKFHVLYTLALFAKSCEYF